MVRESTQTPPEALKSAAQTLDADSQVRAVDLDSMLQSVHSAIEHEDRSLAGYLRSRPTWVRRSVLLAALSVPMVPTIRAGIRGEWGALQTGVTAASALGLAAFAIACAFLSTRPLYRRGLTRGVDWALFIAAIGAMIVAVFVNRDVGHTAPATGTGEIACAGIGVAVALPALLAGRLLHRGSLSAPLLTATAAALMANLGLMLQCPNSGAEHCIFGHASVALWLALPVLLVRRLL